MKLNLDELEQLAAKATPRPWVDEGIGYIRSPSKQKTIAECMPPLCRGLKNIQQHGINAAYIVASCNAVPELVAALKAEREKVKELEAQRDWLASKLGDMCSVSNRDSCGVPEPCPYSKGYCRCLDAGQEEWVQVVKETQC